LAGAAIDDRFMAGPISFAMPSASFAFGALTLTVPMLTSLDEFDELDVLLTAPGRRRARPEIRPLAARHAAHDLRAHRRVVQVRDVVRTDCRSRFDIDAR
jgi:hypothetical protein